MSVEYRDVASHGDLQLAWAVRFEVFVNEQKVPVEEEVDDLDLAPSTIHALALRDGECLGTGRVLLDSPGHVHIGRLAVRQAARGLGIGVGLMEYLERRALAEYAVDGAVTIALSAQEYAMGFYAGLGYAAVTGERYLDAGIWHQDMSKTLHD